MSAIALLFASRKFWVGTITVLAIVVGSVLVSMGKIDATLLVVTIAGIAGTGMTLIGSIAWEDAAEKRSAPQTINTATADVAEKKDEPS